jgi:long-subunit acyl-CoA synthetase (AMP-forming)
VSEAVVIGDRRKFLSALITLNDEAVAVFMKERGLDGRAHESKAIAGEIQKVVDEVNRTLARVEQIKKFTLLSRQFSIDTGELTPTLKIKRKVVNQNFSKEIEAMYLERAE